MRALKGLFLCLTLAGVSFGQYSLGVDFLTELDVQSEDLGDVEVTTTKFTLGIGPSLIIMLNDQLELVPKAGFEIITTDIDSDPGRPRDREGTDYRMWIGAGLFWRLIDASAMRLSLGPDLTISGGDDTLGLPEGFPRELAFTASMPVNVDFLLTQNLFFRMSPRFAEMTVATGDDADADYTDFLFRIRTFWTPRFGFYWTF